MSPEKLEIEPVRCLGKHRCFWYDRVNKNADKRGLCGCFLYLRECGKNPLGSGEVEVGKTICPYRDPGMYNFYEPELI